MKPIVHIVHHVDTEGPLYESLEETFARLNDILGEKLNIEPTRENLLKLQNGLYEGLNTEKKELIRTVVQPHLLQYKTSWSEIDEMLYRILSKKYREKFKDSYGNSWVYNWHIMDHAGFETNPRHRDLGYLNIFDHYRTILKETQSLTQDEIHWHFHPVHFNRQANICATSYENCYKELHQILCRRLIERDWFPIVNRAGLHTERPDSHWFLEQWLPFDASNQAIENDDYCSNGRWGDWKGAPVDWSIYHPDFYDWRKIGGCNRLISRVMNLKTRFRNITVYEIEKAFEKARKQKIDVYLGVTDHDFREISVEIEEFYSDLLQVHQNYQDVDFKFSKSVEAFRAVAGLTEKSLDFDCELVGNVLHIKGNEGEIFGPQPYLALKTKSGDYLHDNLDFGNFKKEYFYTFDIHTVPLDQVAIIKLAANSRSGNQKIKTIDLSHN